MSGCPVLLFGRGKNRQVRIRLRPPVKWRAKCSKSMIGDPLDAVGVLDGLCGVIWVGTSDNIYWRALAFHSSQLSVEPAGRANR